MGFDYGLIAIGKNEVYIPKLQKDIICSLYKYGAQTRRQLVNQFNKPRTTIYDHIVKLMQLNLVRKYTRPRRNERGRPNVFFKLTDNENIRDIVRGNFIG